MRYRQKFVFYHYQRFGKIFLFRFCNLHNLRVFCIMRILFLSPSPSPFFRNVYSMQLLLFIINNYSIYIV